MVLGVDLGTACGFGLSGLVCAAALWACWRVWQQGVGEARRFDRQQRAEAGNCAECGYDLRGGHDRCPECGQPAHGTADLPEPPAEFDLAKLQSDWPDAHIAAVPPQPGELSALAYTTQDSWLANLLIDQLSARGVWVTALDRRQEQVVGGLAITLVHHDLVVPEAEMDRAEAILTRFRNALLSGTDVRNAKRETT